MGLFKKKEKTAVNEIENKELKENLADAALGILLTQQLIAAEDVVGIRAEFAYLLILENHGLEGLFRIIRDQDVYYFAAQQEKLMLIAINEEQYLSTAAYMVKEHLGEDRIEFRGIYLDKDIENG